MNTTEALTIACAIVPDREAVVFHDQRLSFQTLQDNAVRLANALAEMGIGPGDRVATMDVNQPELLEVYFATASLDAVYVPLSFRAKEDELAYMLDSSSPKALLVGESYRGLASTALAKSVPGCRLMGFGDEYRELLTSASPDQMLFPEVDDSDTTVLMYTAGTTGVPKGVMLSHDSLTTYLLSNVEPPDPDSHESNLLPMPLYHIGGFQTALAAVYGGRTLVLMQQFDAEQWLELAQRERPTPLNSRAHHAQATHRPSRSLQARPFQPEGNHLRGGPHAPGRDTSRHRGPAGSAVHQRLRPDGVGSYYCHARPR